MTSMASLQKRETQGKPMNPQPQLEAGHNGPTEAQTESVVAAIEAKMADLRSERALYMSRCRPHHDRIKEIIDDAVERMNFERKALKITVKQREFIRKAEALEDELETIVQDALDLLQRQLGSFADTLLGRAAVQEAREAIKKTAETGKRNRKRSEPPPDFIDDTPDVPFVRDEEPEEPRDAAAE